MAELQVIPQEAIDHLTANPGTASQFDAVFGAGRSSQVLQENNGIPELPPQPEPEMKFISKVWDSTGRAVGYGVQEAASETIDALESFDVWASQQLDELGIPSRLQITDQEGNLDVRLKFFHESVGDQDWLGGQTTETGDAMDLDMVSTPRTVTGQVVGGISQFAAGMLAAGKFTKLAGLRGAFVNGAISDALVFDPKDPNVMKMLDQWGVDTGQLGEVLATDPDDPEYINRLRNVTEGALAGGIVEAIGWGIRAAKAARAGDAVTSAKMTANQKSALKELDDALEASAREVSDDAAESIEFAAKHLVDEPDGQLRLDLGDTPLPDRPSTTKPVQDRIYVTPEQVEKIRLQSSLAKGTTDVDKAAGLSFRSLTTVSNYSEVLDEIGGAQAVLADQFSKIKGGNVQNWTTVKIQTAAKLRSMAQLTGQDPEELIKRFRTANSGDMPRLAAEIHAQERYLISLELELKDMFSVIADANSGKPFDLSKFPGIDSIDHLKLAANQRREVAANLLAGTDAARSNIARAMKAMQIAKEGDQGIRDMLRSPDMFKDIDAIAAAVADPKNAGVPTKTVIDATLEKLHGFMDGVNTYRINALLSGPGTQEVNLISNMINGFVIPLEQGVGGLARGDVKIAKHALMQLRGSVAGMMDSVKAALDAGWWDQAILDPFNGKVEEQVFSQGRTAVGKVVALPSRFLMTMDEFFKQSQYRGRVFADAQQLATEQSLKGQAKTDFIQQYLKESFTDTGGATRSDALLQSRRSTFTEPLEKGVGSVLQKFAIDYPAVRFFIPFVRTPINILSQTFQHVPVLGKLSVRYRADLAAGGVRAAQARGRQIVGTALVAMAGLAAAQGQITGSGPRDPRIRKVWLKNNQPYSFRIPQEDGTIQWVSFARLEPLSNIFSIAADTVEIMNDEYNESETITLIQALTHAAMENTVNKTFTQGIYDAMTLFVGKPHEQASAARNFVASFVPNLLNQTNGDEALREARNMTDAVLARTWLYNGVDPKRNVLGEPIIRALPKYDPLGVFGRDIREVDPVLAEITRSAIVNQSVADSPSRRLPGPNRIDLSTIPYSDTQSLYDKWVEMTGEVEIGGRTLREQLEKTIASREYLTAPEGFLGSTSGTKGSIIRKIITGYRQKAKASIPELMEVIRAEKMGTSEILLKQLKSNRELFPSTPITSQTVRPRTRLFQ